MGAKGVIDCLRLVKERNIRVVCADMKDKLLLKYISDAFYILPSGNLPNFFKAVMRVCEKEHVDVIMPGSANDIFALSKSTDVLRAKGIFTTLSKSTSIEKLKSKAATCDFLRRKNIPVPNFYLVKSVEEFRKAVRELGYPAKTVCFKPADYSISGGGRGFRIIKPSDEYRWLTFTDRPMEYIGLDDVLLSLEKCGEFPELLVMEYLPGKEYSVYCLAKDGETLYCIPHLRQELQLSYSFAAIVEKNEEIIKVCKDVIKVLDLDYNVNMQLKYSEDGIPKVEEINPRMGGSIVLSVVAGVNLPYFGVKMALGEEIPRMEIKYGTRMLRYWDELFFYNSEIFSF